MFVDLKRAAAQGACTRILAFQANSMPTSMPLPPPGFDRLSVAEQIDYVQSLWDRIAANSGHVPTPDWHREILDQRLKESQAVDAGESWDIVRERLRRKLRRRRTK